MLEHWKYTVHKHLITDVDWIAWLRNYAAAPLGSVLGVRRRRLRARCRVGGTDPALLTKQLPTILLMAAVFAAANPYLNERC